LTPLFLPHMMEPVDISACQAAYNAATFTAANLAAAERAFRDLARNELLSVLYVGGWIGYAGGDRRLCHGVELRPLSELVEFVPSDSWAARESRTPRGEVYVSPSGRIFPRPPEGDHFVGKCFGIDAAYAGHVLQLVGLEAMCACGMDERVAKKILVPVLPPASQRSTGTWLNDLCAVGARCLMAQDLLLHEAESQLAAATAS
jgi:hypothetical protein